VTRLDTASLPPERSTSATAAVLVLTAAVLFGTTGTAQALGPTDTTPLGVGATRLLIGGVALLAVLPLLGVRPTDAIRLWWSPIAVLAGVCTALYQVCFFAAVSDAGVALGTLVTIGSGPVFAGMLARLLLGERLAVSWVAAIALCVGGLTLLTLDGAGQIDAGVIPLLLALAAGLAYAGYTVAAKRLTTAGENSSAVMASAFALGGLLLVPVLLTQPLGWLATPAGVTMALYLGLATTSLAYVLFGKGLAVLPAGPVTTLVLAEPLVATTLGVTLLDERLAPLGLIGAALVFVGLALQGLAVSRRRPTVPSLPS
jgi:drug/metabolite transporter, DME family